MSAYSSDGSEILADELSGDDKSVERVSETDRQTDVSTKFSQSRELVILTENDRQWLLEEAESVIDAYKNEIVSLLECNKLLHEYLRTTNVSIYEETSEEERQSTLKYQNILEEYQAKHQQKLDLEAEIDRSTSLVAKKKANREDRMAQLRSALKDEIVEVGVKAINVTTGQPLSELFASKLFDRFVKVHDELSKIRLEFISTQKALVELEVKLSQTNDLGDGFKVADYDNLKTEVQTISSNIELKSEQLDKLRQRFHDEDQKAKSIKSKHSNVTEKTEKLKKLYESQRLKEAQLRHELFGLKRHTNDLREELDELSQKAGILKRVGLMRHFDRVSDEIEELTKLVQDAQGVNESFITRIKQLKFTG